jgi:hypothetical protein
MQFDHHYGQVHEPSLACTWLVYKRDLRVGYNQLIMRRLLAWNPLVTIFLILVALIVLIMVISWQINRITQPINEIRGDISTQVASIFHSTPTVLPDPVTIVREIRALSRLETIQYTIEKVITAETGQGALGFLFGDRILFVAHGIVIAGVDLSKLEPDDVWVDEGGRVYIRLPEAEIFVATLDNENSYVYDRQRGFLTAGDINLETTARQVAEEVILEAALEDGILEQARINAESVIYRLLRSLNYIDVIFVDSESANPTHSLPSLTPDLITPTP